MEWLETPGFWFAIGIIAGIIIDIGGRLFVDCFRRPILRFPQVDKDAT